MFNEDSQIPEHYQGHNEAAVQTDHGQAPEQPSVAATNRYNIPPWLQRRYLVETSKAGNPYFAVNESILLQCIAGADDAFAEARAFIASDEERSEQVDDIVAYAKDYRSQLLRVAGEDRAWLADMMVLWPLSDQVGYQLYNSTSRKLELVEYGTYLLRDPRNPNIDSVEALQTHDGFLKSQAWLEMHYRELGVFDAIYTGIKGEADYNVDAIIRKGYQSAANLDTRKHLRGAAGQAPVTEDTASADVADAISKSISLASAAA